MKEMSALARQFYDYLKYSKSALTAYNYSRNVDSFLGFVKKPLEKIGPLDITNWYSSLERQGSSARTIWRYGWALKSFFELMNLQELSKRTPIVAYQVPEPKWLEKPSTFKVIGRVPPLCVGYDLALRVGELKFLRRSKFNAETGDILVTRLKHKGHTNTYTLKLDRWCLEILNRYLMLKVREDMFPMDEEVYQDSFTDRATSSGFKDYTFQCLRHSRITHIAIQELEQKGFVDELSLAKFAGHLRVETTRMYVHLATKYLAFGRKERHSSDRRFLKDE